MIQNFIKTNKKKIRILIITQNFVMLIILKKILKTLKQNNNDQNDSIS